MARSLPMTYASQQLADALQELANEKEDKKGYSVTRIPTSIDTMDAGLVFPSAVANFLDEANHYCESTRAVSVGVY